VVLPNISSISPQTGAIGGQEITITGSGFSLTPGNNVVTVDATPCNVNTVNANQLTCTLGAKDLNQSSLLLSNANTTNATNYTQLNGYESGSGFFYNRYDII
jgi:hypothetical protein